MTERTDDYDAVVRVVQLYIDGFNDNDIAKFKEALSRRRLDVLYQPRPLPLSSPDLREL
jgi:hypothetical protein